MTVQVGAKVPSFRVPSTAGEFSLDGVKGKTLVLYFYPKDNTPGCTTEGADFANNADKFRRANAVIAGVSRDSVKSHAGFKAKMGFPFELLADTEETLCELFDVIRLKNMYGKKVRGIERSTFVIGGDGHLKREWRGVKVANHVDEVLSFVQSMSE